MKSKLLISAAAGLTLFAIEAQSQILLNGGFEDGGGSGVTRSFDVTANWYNRGTGSDQGQVARRESTDTGSLFVGQINDRYDVVNATSDFDSSAFGAITHSQKTGYAIQSGEQYELSYEWQDAFNWNDGLDEVRFVLFATSDNTLGGTVLWSSILDSGTSTQDNVYETVNQTSSIVAAGAVGQNLFVNVFGFQNNGALSANPGFARIDNISITAVPEPATFALLSGLGALSLILIRRKRMNRG